MRGVQIIAAIVTSALLLSAPASAAQDTERYWGKTGGSKLRVGVQGDRVVGMVFHGETKCTYRGESVTPHFGTGVTSGFNNADLGRSGSFISHQEYRHRSPFSKERLPFVRTVSGEIADGEGSAYVAIHFKTPLDTSGEGNARCSTGRIRFDLRRVDDR